MGDTGNLVLAQSGSVYTADSGTAAPSDPDGAVGGSWNDVGLINDEGASFSKALATEIARSWQRRGPSRRWATEDDVSASFSLQEWTGDNVVFAFGGGEITEPSPGIYKYEFPTSADGLDERALLIRWEDEGNHYQLYFERGTITEAVETGLNRSSLSELPIAFGVLASEESDTIGVELLTDDPAFDPGS